MRILLAIGALIASALLFMGPTAYLATESWWYSSMGASGVFNTELLSHLGLGATMGLGMLAILGVNLLIVHRSRPREGVWVSENVFELKRGATQEQIGLRLAIGLAVLFAVAAAVEGSTHWSDWLLWRHGGSFGRIDSVFHNDVGFYVFRLPFIDYLNRWLFFAFVLCFFFAAAMHVAMRSIQFTPRSVHVEPSVRRHALLLGGLMLALYAVHVHLSAYALLWSEGSLFTGPNYTDLHATLPVLRIVTVLAGLCGLACFLNAAAKGWKLSAVTFAVLIVVEMLGQGVYPGLVQRFTVAPNELDKERPYITDNIAATRFGYNLEHVEEKEFAATDDLKYADVAQDRATLDNVRLWDQGPLLRTYRQLQEIRTYYDFNAVDNDRYTIDGHLQQISLAVRELGYAHLPSRNWINEHLTYTHGFGICAGPVSKISSVGLPEFYVKNLPPESTVKSLDVAQPRIYYGEESNEYALVKTGEHEFDYPSGDQSGPGDQDAARSNGDNNVYNTYDGPAVSIGGLLRKIAFALRFEEPKILLSSELQATSGVLYHRNVRDRAACITPFVHYDEDAYIVVSHGRLYWILDGYTTADAVPYSQMSMMWDEPINYIRNSVKTVVDAYSGAVQAYISDPSDPLVNTYARIFPGVYRPMSDMDPDLAAHIRYPQALFALQAEVQDLYHMDDAQEFYNKEDVWRVPEGGDNNSPMRPYYTILRFPGDKNEEFILMTLFTQAKRQNMIAYMAARCDAPNYGKLVLYKFPKQKLIYGPAQIDARINQDPEISRQLTLWGQQGSTVKWGAQLVIPVHTSLIYVKPLYIESTNASGLPQLQRVIVAYGDRVAMRATLDESLAAVFNVESAPAGASTAASGPANPLSSLWPDATSQTSVPAAPSGYEALAAEAEAHMQKARKCLHDDDWAGYGDEMHKLEATLQRMQALRVKH